MSRSRDLVHGLRRKVARSIWALADRIYPYPPETQESDVTRGWEITAYFEADEKTANEVFDRMSDATCGVPHHPLEPCPGPPAVLSMRPAEEDPEAGVGPPAASIAD